MKYVALLRGVNVGKSKRVEMKKLKAVFESAGCFGVSTYINSGNVIFESRLPKGVIARVLEKTIRKEFGPGILLMIKTKKEMADIAKAIPSVWKNDADQRTDVAYLFKEIDSRKVIDDLPMRKDLVALRYVKGAVIWNLERKNLGKSRLSKLIGSEAYRHMTMRNVNTARFLAGD